jgi:hypothetical protein
MEAKDCKFKIEVQFSKNRHYPEYGENAYSIESHSIYIPYGRKFDFKSSVKAIEFVKSRIDENVLNSYDSISITTWRGYGGSCEYLKHSYEKSDINPIGELPTHGRADGLGF